MRSLRRSAALCALIALFAVCVPLAKAADPAPLFTQTMGFATKTGFRLVFAWEASEKVLGNVRYGTDPANLNQTAFLPTTTPDLAQMAVGYARGPVGTTYYWQVEDQLTGRRSDIKTVKAANAYNDWDPAAGAYTLDLLVQIDAESLPPEIPYDLAVEDVAAGINVFAERLYDALDGYARLGNVLITDTNLDYPVNPPAYSPDCVFDNASVADVLIQTTVPMDSHTWGGWAIANPCISFYVGRVGWLGTPWADDLQFGFVAAHEMAHYAFNAPDLYSTTGTGGCRNLEWDGSLMHNTGAWNGVRWEMTELDRSPELTPCDHGDNDYSWQTLIERYTNVPADDAPSHIIDDQPRGNEDGGALDITILDRSQVTGESRLRSFTPDDGEPVTPPTCGPADPQLVDAAGDATGFYILESSPLPSEKSLDLLDGDVRWDATNQAVTFRLTVDDLTAEPPMPGTGHIFRFYFTYRGVAYQVQMGRQLGSATYSIAQADVAQTAVASGLSGTFDDATDTVTVTVPTRSRLPGAPANAPVWAQGELLDGLEGLAQRYAGRLTLSADTAGQACSYRIGQEG